MPAPCPLRSLDHVIVLRLKSYDPAVYLGGIRPDHGPVSHFHQKNRTDRTFAAGVRKYIDKR